MRPQSAKAKGRRLQQEVRDAVLAAFPALEPDDVTSRSMGAGGTDLLLSPAAKRLFPCAVECKNQENLNIWAALKQAWRDAAEDRTWGQDVPIVVFRRNLSLTYVALELHDFLAILKRAHG